MPGCRYVLPIVAVLATHALGAQSPPERIQAGFKTLSTGSWETAFREWIRDGSWVDVDGKLQMKLEGAIPGPRSVGHWESVNPPYLTLTWQRHWLMASFDQGAMFFVFDYMNHKGQWRLVALRASQDPDEVLPHLDMLPGVLAARNSQ
jgi:hypothetical protein